MTSLNSGIWFQQEIRSLPRKSIDFHGYDNERYRQHRGIGETNNIRHVPRMLFMLNRCLADSLLKLHAIQVVLKKLAAERPKEKETLSDLAYCTTAQVPYREACQQFESRLTLTLDCTQLSNKLSTAGQPKSGAKTNKSQAVRHTRAFGKARVVLLKAEIKVYLVATAVLAAVQQNKICHDYQPKERGWMKLLSQELKDAAAQVVHEQLLEGLGNRRYKRRLETRIVKVMKELDSIATVIAELYFKHRLRDRLLPAALSFEKPLVATEASSSSDSTTSAGIKLIQ